MGIVARQAGEFDQKAFVGLARLDDVIVLIANEIREGLGIIVANTLFRFRAAVTLEAFLLHDGLDFSGEVHSQCRRSDGGEGEQRKTEKEIHGAGRELGVDE